MRIDELDPKHKDFKQVILDHNLTEEQLDEILPVVGAVAGGVARAAGAVGGAALRGAGAVARGAAGMLARGAGAVARGAGAVARGAGNMARGAGQQIKQTAKDQINKKVQSFAQDTANKLANQGGGQQDGQQGNQTIGQDNSQAPQAQLSRGSELNVPLADPKKPNQTKMTPMKVKKVTGQDIELEPAKKAPGVPSTLKFNKKDLAF